MTAMNDIWYGNLENGDEYHITHFKLKIIRNHFENY